MKKQKEIRKYFELSDKQYNNKICEMQLKQLLEMYCFMYLQKKKGIK